MMRAAIERDGIAWEEMCAQRSECGKRAADLKSLMSQGILMKKLSRQLHQQIMQKKKPQGINDTAEKTKSFSQTKRFSEKAKKADKDIDIDKDKDTDIDIDKDTDKDKDKDKAIDKEKKEKTQGQRSLSSGLSAHIKI